MGRFAEWLRRVLHARSPDEMEGITISGPCWEVSDKGLDHAAFFRALPMLVGEGATLVVEGGSHPPELRTLLEGHSVPGRSKVALGTVWPRGTVFHVPASRTVVAALAAVCEHCAYPEICDHLHVYDNDSVLLQWYDAFSQPLWVSKRVSGGAMEAFCGELRVTFREIDSP